MATFEMDARAVRSAASLQESSRVLGRTFSLICSLSLLFAWNAFSANASTRLDSLEARFGPTEAEDAKSYPLIGRFRNTFYYVAPEAEMDSTLPLDAAVRTLEGAVIARVPRAFKKAMDIEGTGRLRDGRVVNFAGVVEREIRYQETVHPWGRGVGDCPLVPFRSVAVDRTKVALGSTVYIEETAGKRLPDGTFHDGLWRADDVGGAIKQDRVDLFTGDGYRSGDLLTQWGIRHMNPITLRLVAPPAEKNCTQETPR